MTNTSTSTSTHSSSGWVWHGWRTHRSGRILWYMPGFPCNTSSAPNSQMSGVFLQKHQPKQCTWGKGPTPQNYRTIKFDPPEMGHLMTPAMFVFQMSRVCEDDSWISWYSQKNHIPQYTPPPAFHSLRRLPVAPPSEVGIPDVKSKAFKKKKRALPINRNTREPPILGGWDPMTDTWLMTMGIIISPPNLGVAPLPNGLFMAYKWRWS